LIDRERADTVLFGRALRDRLWFDDHAPLVGDEMAAVGAV
jgi:hypothetical protein